MEWRLLEGVPEGQVRELLQVARRRTFARNEVVFHRDDPGDSLHLVSKGRFAVRVMTPLGETVTVAVRGRERVSVRWRWCRRARGGRRRSLRWRMARPFRSTGMISSWFVASYPSVSELLFRLLTNEVRLLNERLLDALYLPVERRVLRRLVELAELYRVGDGVVVVALPPGGRGGAGRRYTPDGESGAAWVAGARDRDVGSWADRDHRLRRPAVTVALAGVGRAVLRAGPRRRSGGRRVL